MIEVSRGGSPLILGLPHTGTDLPTEVYEALNETGREMADTDWHIDRLYSGLIGDLTTVRTPIHRYAIDVNRDPSGESLYPGQNTTGLCPLTDFDGTSLYAAGAEPDRAEVSRRLDTYHRPYHAAMEAEIARIKAKHGFAVLYDCHSIRSVIPFLFDGTLPDFNIGTNSGAACESTIENAVAEICGAADGYTSVVNGRFRGGWTTRHYGKPAEGVHAIQMELTQSSYMDEAAPWTYRPDRTERLRPYLKRVLETLRDWKPA